MKVYDLCIIYEELSIGKIYSVGSYSGGVFRNMGQEDTLVIRIGR